MVLWCTGYLISLNWTGSAEGRSGTTRCRCGSVYKSVIALLPALSDLIRFVRMRECHLSRADHNFNSMFAEPITEHSAY